MRDYKEFFENLEDGTVRVNFLVAWDNFTIEELYQAFKARLMDELKVSSIALPELAELVDPNPEGEK